MSCTTLLVGKKATYDGSTMIARNEDCGSGHYNAKRLIVVLPEDQPREYHSTISHVTIPLPDDPLRYTAMPDVDKTHGIWGAAGVNSANVGMTATETITSNERVLAADPPVAYEEAKDGKPEKIGGIGEEDLVSLTLPYIHSAREGVLRLGRLLETYGTYEMNGIAFQDVDEIWWLETIGGHHWMARRVPDDCYVIAPNILSIDHFDFDDAYGAGENYLCSDDLQAFVSENHLDLSMDGSFDPRAAFGSHTDEDHIYNTPRAWIVERYFNPNTYAWEGPDADFTPSSDDIPWCMVPEKKITVEDVKYALSNHFQGTPFDPYARHGDLSRAGSLRPIGVNRTNFLSVSQIRPYVPEESRSVEWICFASNVHNALVPLYTNVDKVPDYYDTGLAVTTDRLYWNSRLIAALADPYMPRSGKYIEWYQLEVQARGHHLLDERDKMGSAQDADGEKRLNEETNEKIAAMVRERTQVLLSQTLFEASEGMKNGFSRSDA